MPYVQRKRTYRKRYTRKRAPRTRYNKRGSAAAYRALRIAKSVNRKVAGELCKFQLVPSNFGNISLSPDASFNNLSITGNKPLNTITSGTPWIMPLNWYYFTSITGTSSANSIYFNGISSPVTYTSWNSSTGPLSQKVPLYYNTMEENGQISEDGVFAGLQYRMAYLYIRGIFNASVNNSTDNTDGAVRFVIVKDKQPQGGSATWYDAPPPDSSNNYSGLSSRGVFNANLIDAQINPQTAGRFKIIYDKTMRFTTINGYKPFKYFKRLSTIVRNTRQSTDLTFNLSNTSSTYETNERAPPVLKNAYYLMIFSDGCNFTYSDNSSTPAAGFHLFSRIGYYNN